MRSNNSAGSATDVRKRLKRMYLRQLSTTVCFSAISSLQDLSETSDCASDIYNVIVFLPVLELLSTGVDDKKGWVFLLSNASRR